MIPLYRGELHKVSGLPRQWSIPKTQIPLSVFRNALQKRNAALNEFLESTAARQANGHATPVANGTVETSGLASADGSGDHGKRGGSENDGDSTPDDGAENGVGSSEGKSSSSTDRSERVEEEIEWRQERKRRREEDSREDSGGCIDRKEDSARRDGVESEAPSRGKCKVSHEGAEPMVADGPDQAVAMECDDNDAEKSVIGGDETMADQVRVRVSEVGAASEMDSKQGDPELGARSATEAKQKDAGHVRRNGELAHPAAVSSFEETKSAEIQLPAAQEGNPSGAGSGELRVIDNKIKKREELEAKLERLRAEKHRFVLRLKQVLHEEEVKKRGSLASGSPRTVQGAVAGANDVTGVSTHGEKHVIGATHKSTDLEDGELEYARTPSPPARAIPNLHGSVSSHVTLGPPPLAPVIGRQTSLSQHLSQAYQHASAIHAQKVTSVSHGHGQFSPGPSSGAPVGAGVSGGPPGFSGYPMSSTAPSHHSHLSQPAASSLPHIVGQPGVSSSSLLTTPRGPPGYHDMRLGGSTWIQR